MKATSNRHLTPAVGDPMQGAPEASGASDTAEDVRSDAQPAARAPATGESSPGSQPADPPAEITQVLDAVGRSEAGASDKLLPLVYAELRRLAAVRMAHELAGQTLQPTALVHEAWLRLVNDGDRTWQNRAHFFSAAAEAMRRILIERARHRSRLKHGGGQARLNIEDLELAETTADDKVLLVNEALERLKAEDPELERIVVLKFFAGLNNAEIAETLGLASRTLDRQWAYAKAWLFRAIREQA